MDTVEYEKGKSTYNDLPLSRVYKDIVDEDKSSLGSDAYSMEVDKDFKGVLSFTKCGQKTYDLDNNLISQARFDDMSAEEKAECVKVRVQKTHAHTFCS